MANTEDGGPAFPQFGREDRDYFNIERGRTEVREQLFTSGGMLLRDYFAAQALPQAIAHERDIRSAMIAPGTFRFDAVADAAYTMADAMLAARSK